MPFFLTNENVEAIIEDNPDDIFTPSDINQNTTTRNTTIRQLISQEINHTFETTTKKTVDGNALFSNVDSLKDDNCSSYLFTFETDNDQYEITYHIPFTLAAILEHNSKDGIVEIKSKINEEIVVSNKEIFLNLSNSIITCLNAQDFTFLQDIKLIDLCSQRVENGKNKILKNLYSFNVSIDKKEYTFYLQLDSQFNKIF